jgi:AcrR family transcriptional regulator
MDMVARRSGLSKSSLYSHFKNRQDMLSRLFQLEFKSMARYIRAGKKQGKGQLEQFYLALLAMADYLRSRPEILITMDWVKTRRIELGIAPPRDIFAVFSGIPAVERLNRELSPNWVFYWALFLIITTLVCSPWGGQVMGGAKVPDSSFRKVFKFLTLGVEGYRSVYEQKKE